MYPMAQHAACPPGRHAQPLAGSLCGCLRNAVTDHPLTQLNGFCCWGAWCGCNDAADAGAVVQGDHPVAMHTVAMLLLNTTKPQCPSAIGFLQNLAFRKPSIHHIAFGRHAWTRGNAHRAFFHFLAAGEAGAEIALMNAHWILARGCACLPRLSFSLQAHNRTLA